MDWRRRCIRQSKVLGGAAAYWLFLQEEQRSKSDGRPSTIIRQRRSVEEGGGGRLVIEKTTTTGSSCSRYELKYSVRLISSQNGEQSCSLPQNSSFGTSIAQVCVNKRVESIVIQKWIPGNC
jgi:hypothetical protein